MYYLTKIISFGPVNIKFYYTKNFLWSRLIHLSNLLSSSEELFNYMYFLNPYLRICLLILEREEGRERETLIGCLSYAPWPGIEPPTFWCMGRCSNQLSHPARADQLHFLLKYFIHISYKKYPHFLTVFNLSFQYQILAKLENNCIFWGHFGWF